MTVVCALPNVALLPCTKLESGEVTLRFTPLLAVPLAWTTTFPDDVPLGTCTVIDIALQLTGLAVVPLNCTVLAPCVVPKPEPLMVIANPDPAVVADRLVIVGEGSTVNGAPLLLAPPTVTTTFPVLAPAGTGATICVALQLVGVATVPLKLTVLDPCVAPKFVPVIVTEAPSAPEVGDKLVMFGAATTVKLTPLLFTPLACTMTLPVVAPLGTGTAIDVALQLVGVATVPLKLTVLDPCVAPKFVPVIVTEAPTAPEFGDRLVTVGAATTVKLTPLLFTPLA